MPQQWIKRKIIFHLKNKYLLQINNGKWTTGQGNIVSNKMCMNIRNVKLIGWLNPGPTFTITKDHLLEIIITTKHYEECIRHLENLHFYFDNDTHVCGIPKVKDQKLTWASKCV